MALNHSVGKKESNGKRCLPAYYMFYLPIGFLISFAVLLLSRVRYQQSRTLSIPPVSITIKWDWVFLLLTFTQLLICLCWYLWVKIAKQLQLNRGCLTQELLCPEQSGSYVLTWIEEKKQSTFEDPLDQRQEQRCSWQLPFVSLAVGNSLYRARHISER